MTKTEILQRVVSHFREEHTPVRWTPDEIFRYVDDGYDEIAERSGAVVRTFATPVAADNHIVDLPKETVFCISMRDVTIADTTYVLHPCHWTRIDALNGTFIRKMGPRPELFAAFGLTKVLLDTAFSAPGILELVAAALPEVLGPDDQAAIQSEFQDGLVEYAIFRCLLKDVVAGDDLGRALNGYKAFKDAATRLGGYASDRHTNLRKATYGEPKRAV